MEREGCILYDVDMIEVDFDIKPCNASDKMFLHCHKNYYYGFW